MNPVRLDPEGPFKRDPLAPHRHCWGRRNAIHDVPVNVI